MNFGNSIGNGCLILFIIVGADVAVVGTVILPAPTVQAAENQVPKSLSQTQFSDADIEFFERRIRPVLVTHCYECHSRDAKKIGGGLRLDSRAAVLRGGDSGASVEPGRPGDSLLIRAVRYGDSGLQMPPSGKLPANAVADLEEWVRRGIPDPRAAVDVPGVTPSEPAANWETTLRQRRTWWSLQLPRKSPLPQINEPRWSKNLLDRYLFAQQHQAGLAPAPVASPHKLVRRLYLVLTGLPPTADQVSRFVNTWNVAGPDSAGPSNAGPSEVGPEDSDWLTEGRERALVQLVDSLMSSPSFGERWARHWMDLVRFTETHGNEWNYEVHHAWRYRDYLIRAFNSDVPYDRFVLEHIAGDLLEPRWNQPERLNESLIGTGFYRFGEVNHDDCISLREIGFDLIDNQIDTLTKAFQATTVSCARCHDHKFDAVSMKDYYALLGILKSSRLVAHTIDSPEVNVSLKDALVTTKLTIRKELFRLWQSDVERLPEYLRAALAQVANRPELQPQDKQLNGDRLAKWVAALKLEKQPLDEIFEPVRRLIQGKSFEQTSSEYSAEDRSREAINRTEFTTFADFRSGFPHDWQRTGQGALEAPAKHGEIVIANDGEKAVTSLLFSGTYTHRLSDRLNGALRSPVIPSGTKHISFEVLGQRSSALRLVSNNCQLNYKNYRALISADLHWITFSPPDDRDHLRTYAELMTMFDNPKFPDQLSALGGDKENYKLPWEKAAVNPRSYFGLRRVVLHDCPDPPKARLDHLRPLLDRSNRFSIEEMAQRYQSVAKAALDRLRDDQATDNDVTWINGLLRLELLTNERSATPKLTELVDDYRTLERQLELPRVCAGVGDHGSGDDHVMFVRGDCQRHGELAPRRFLEVLVFETENGPNAVQDDPAGSGRLGLAKRIANSQNPLTARVAVNRVWHLLFGTGIVKSVDDFGHIGDLPSHPELLDELAIDFVESGWSMKRLIRSIVLSETFRLASAPSELAKEVDPNNRLLQHFPARRLEAEAIRDSILHAAGSLRNTIGGPSIYPWRDKEYADRRLFPGPVDGAGRRSLYVKNNLMEPPRFLSAFDFPGGKVAQGRREITNVPAQALALLNDPFVIQQADTWAKRLLEERRPGEQRPGEQRQNSLPVSGTCSRELDVSCTFDERLNRLFSDGLQRLPTMQERERFLGAAKELCRVYHLTQDEAVNRHEIWRDLAHAIFNLQEFIFIP